MPSTEPNQQPGKDAHTRERDGGNGDGSNTDTQSTQKYDDPIILTSQPSYYHQNHQTFTMYPGALYSIDQSQADMAMLPGNAVYPYPVYYTSDTYPHHPGFEEHFQTSASSPYTPVASTPYHFPAVMPQPTAGETSQGYGKKLPNFFDNTSAKYTADWVSHTTLIPSEMKVPPDQPGDSIGPDSRGLTPKNWTSESYSGTSSKSPLNSKQPEALDQQLAKMNITAYSIPALDLSQPPPSSQLPGGGSNYGGYNWPGTSQQPLFRQIKPDGVDNIVPYNGGKPSTWADVIKKSGTNTFKGQQPEKGGGYSDQRGTQSAQQQGSQFQSQVRPLQSQGSYFQQQQQPARRAPFIQQSGSATQQQATIIRPPRTPGSTGPRSNYNGFRQPNNNRQGPPSQQQQPRFPSQSNQYPPLPPPRGPIPSLLPQQRAYNFNRPPGGSNYRGQQQPQPSGSYTSMINAAIHQLMPEFNPGVPPPALPPHYRPGMPPPQMFPFTPPTPMVNPQQQHYMGPMIPQIPYGYDPYTQRFYQPNFPFGPPQPYQPFNSRMQFNNRGPRKPRSNRPFNNTNQRRYNQGPTLRSNEMVPTKEGDEDPSNDDHKPLDDELADSVNRGKDFDQDEVSTPEPKGDETSKSDDSIENE